MWVLLRDVRPTAFDAIVFWMYKQALNTTRGIYSLVDRVCMDQMTNAILDHEKKSSRKWSMRSREFVAAVSECRNDSQLIKYYIDQQTYDMVTKGYRNLGELSSFDGEVMVSC